MWLNYEMPERKRNSSQRESAKPNPLNNAILNRRVCEVPSAGDMLDVLLQGRKLNTCLNSQDYNALPICDVFETKSTRIQHHQMDVILPSFDDVELPTLEGFCFPNGCLGHPGNPMQSRLPALANRDGKRLTANLQKYFFPSRTAYLTFADTT